MRPPETSSGGGSVPIPDVTAAGVQTAVSAAAPGMPSGAPETTTPAGSRAHHPEVITVQPETVSNTLNLRLQYPVLRRVFTIHTLLSSCFQTAQFMMPGTGYISCSSNPSQIFIIVVKTYYL